MFKILPLCCLGKTLSFKLKRYVFFIFKDKCTWYSRHQIIASANPTQGQMGEKGFFKSTLKQIFKIFKVFENF